MAEALGLAASIIQIAGAGAQLSTTLYNFIGSATRADQEISDIADDVKLTANALESVGEVFKTEKIRLVVSEKAIQDAKDLLKRCDAIFSEINELIGKRRKPNKNGVKTSSFIGKMSWPMKGPRVELHQRRLESLKNSLMLLLHVLQLAQGQSKGKMHDFIFEQERARIRELHARQQESLKALQELEMNFSGTTINEDENNLLQSLPAPSQTSVNTFTTNLVAIPEDPETSDDEPNASGDEEGHLTMEEISNCAKHVSKLLKRITAIQQQTQEVSQPHCRYSRHYVRKTYRRFCKNFERQIGLPEKDGAPPMEPRSIHSVEHPLIMEALREEAMKRACSAKFSQEPQSYQHHAHLHQHQLRQIELQQQQKKKRQMLASQNTFQPPTSQGTIQVPDPTPQSAFVDTTLPYFRREPTMSNDNLNATAPIASHELRLSPSMRRLLPFTEDIPVESPSSFNNTDVQNTLNQNARKTALSADQRSKAAMMRTIAPCYNCKIRKLRCDNKVPCTSCMNYRKFSISESVISVDTCRGIPIGTVEQVENNSAADRGPVIPFCGSNDAESGTFSTDVYSAVDAGTSRSPGPTEVGKWLETRCLAPGGKESAWEEIDLQHLQQQQQQQTPDDQSHKRKNRGSDYGDGDADLDIEEPVRKKQRFEADFWSKKTGNFELSCDSKSERLMSPISTERDIVDVLLSEWTVSVA